MDIVNPDLSHSNFLELAKSDVESAELLLNAKQ